MPGLKEIFLSFLRAFYDNLILICMLSFAWTLLSLPIVTIGPVTAGVYYVLNMALQNEDVKASHFLEGACKHWKEALLVTLFVIAMAVLLIFNTMVTANMQTMVATISTFIWVYGMIFLIMMATYLFPLIVAYETGILETIKRSAFLAVDNIIVTTGAAGMSLIFILAGLVLPPAFMLFGMGGIAITGLTAFHTIVIQYQQEVGDEPHEENLPDPNETGNRKD